MQRRASDQIDLTKVVDGKDGTSVTILGSYNTMAELEAAHPTGNLGDAYMVSGDLVVWNGSAWENVGRIQGPQGPAGRGISNITEYYAINNSTTAPADSAFDTTVKTPTATNRYLWNYELITYTDSTSKKMDKHIVAVYGEQGQTGKGISSVTEYYAKNNSTTAPADSAFGTSVVTADSSNKYVWNYELITYTDNTTSKTSKRIIGMYGETGPQGGTGPAGPDGISVTSVQPQYYLSTSSSSATGGSWGTTITYVSGKYIWTRSKNSYSDGSVDYSTEIYNEALTQACQNALAALATAQAVNQYTWHTETDTGAGAGTHITMIPQDEFLADPANGGFNVLINSLGTFIRDGLTVTAFYGATNRVGESNNARVEVSSTEINAYDQNGATAFSVQSDGAASTKDISVRKTIEAFSALRNDTATYTLPNTPIANSQVVVSFYAGGAKYSFSYLYGTTGQHIESSVGITFDYSGNTITAIATQYAIAWAAVTYTTRTTNALVDIPAELHIQTENFTDFLFDPKLSSDSLLDYGSRTQDIYGGYAIIGKWVFVDVGFDVDVGMSANNFWRVIDGLPVPAGGQAVLTVLFWDESDADSSGNRKPKVLGGYVNSSGRLIIVTQGTALAYDDSVYATGWYIAQ